MILKKLALLFIITVFLGFTSCSPKDHVNRSHHTVKTYKSTSDDGSFIYWYIFYNTMVTSSESNRTSYISSSVPLTSFRGLTPMSSSEKEIKEELEKENAELESENEVMLEDQPESMQQEEQDMNEQEAVADSQNETADTSGADSGSDSGSTDSSGGDSGGGDSSGSSD